MNIIIKFLLVFLGSGLGGMMRFGIVHGFELLNKPSPYAIMCCNIMGCFMVGLLFSYCAVRADMQNISLLLITGIMGGFTTFSAFGLDAVKIFQQENLINSACYILLSVIISIFLCLLGIKIGQFFFGQAL
jgi:CrcB protein